MVNATLVAEGYAQVATYPPDLRYVDLFLGLQEEARVNGLGLWEKQAPVGGQPCDPAYLVCASRPRPQTWTVARLGLATSGPHN